MTAQSPNVEVAIAEISRDIKYIAKRLDEGTVRFDMVEARVAKLADHVNRMYGGLVLAPLVVPMALTFVGNYVLALLAIIIGTLTQWPELTSVYPQLTTALAIVNLLLRFATYEAIGNGPKS